MSGARNSPTSPRFPHKPEQHSWDECSSAAALSSGVHQHSMVQQGGSGKVPTRTASSPLPYKCPKSPRNFNIPTSNVYDQAPRSPSSRSTYSAYSQYSEPSTVVNRSARVSDNQPRSPKITTTYANDSQDDTSSTPSYYQTPTSGSRSPKGFSSQENSLDSPYFSGGGLSSASPRRSPKSPRKFVFDAISPSVDPTSKKFEYYEPMSPDDDPLTASGGIYYEAPHSPQFFETRRQSFKKHQQQQQRIVPQIEKRPCYGYVPDTSAKHKHTKNDWELPLAGSTLEECHLRSPSYYIKRDSCVTESTQLSAESNDTTHTATTTTTSFTYSDHSHDSARERSRSGNSSPSDNIAELAVKRNASRRHAINITSNPGYQVLHSSHSTLDRTCSDSVVSLRYRKSTSDLTKDSKDAEFNKSKPKPAESNNSVVGAGGGAGGGGGCGGTVGNNHKPRRRGSSKGGLAYLASRRSSRDSMKSACSNTSIFSNDDIGPLAFQASNRGRQRRTSNFLELPVPDHVRPRVCSLPDRPYNPRVSDDLYRLRHFSISKGNVVNCGDSIISRRSRSNTSVNSTNSRASERSPFEGSCCGGGYANVDSMPASPDDSENSDPPPPPRYRVVMLGDAGVGKTALVSQFMTSEYMHTYDASLDDEFGEKTVSVLLDDEESEMVFIDHPSVEMSVENSLSTYEPHGCVVVFSVVDKSSFRVAEEIINYLWQENYTKDKAVILVGNKADLARARVITTQEGKSLAASRDAKFIETSSGIQHNVDELLVGILKQMRLKETREKKATSSKMKTSRTHISLHLAKEILQKICLSDISKSKSCENLHVL